VKSYACDRHRSQGRDSRRQKVKATHAPNEQTHVRGDENKMPLEPRRNTYVGIMGGGSPPPPPALPGGGGGPRPPGAPGAALGGCGGWRDTGGGCRRGAPPGEGGAAEIDELLGGGIQSALTGGGAGVLTVAIETSPMILSASLQAWY